MRSLYVQGVLFPIRSMAFFLFRGKNPGSRKAMLVQGRTPPILSGLAVARTTEDSGGILFIFLTICLIRKFHLLILKPVYPFFFFLQSLSVCFHSVFLAINQNGEWRRVDRFIPLQGKRKKQSSAMQEGFIKTEPCMNGRMIRQGRSNDRGRSACSPISLPYPTA